MRRLAMTLSVAVVGDGVDGTGGDGEGGGLGTGDVGDVGEVGDVGDVGEVGDVGVVGANVESNSKWFDAVLSPFPPGPTAATRASSTTVVIGGEDISLAKST